MIENGACACVRVLLKKATSVGDGRPNSRKALSLKKASSAGPATALSGLNQPQLPNKQTQAPKWPCRRARCPYTQPRHAAATARCQRRRRGARGSREKTRIGRRGSPLRSTGALPPPPNRSPSTLLPLRLSHHRASHRDAPVSTRKTERRARDAREKTSA